MKPTIKIILIASLTAASVFSTIVSTAMLNPLAMAASLMFLILSSFLCRRHADLLDD